MNENLAPARPAPCPRCRRNRWKTLVKGLAWMCRNCRQIRDTTAAAAA